MAVSESVGRHLDGGRLNEIVGVHAAVGDDMIEVDIDIGFGIGDQRLRTTDDAIAAHQFGRFRFGLRLGGLLGAAVTGFA